MNAILCARRRALGENYMLDFIAYFKALTGNEPFHWQRKLYERLLHGELPDVCDIPTGLGKTSIIAIWLMALAELLRRGEACHLPRRLVYVVDRRTVVDQASKEAEELIEKISSACDSTGEASEQKLLHQLAQIFKGAASSAGKEIIALSKLRGAHADNREWCLDPTRPAIIVGTVDMIGSRLLFAGYGGVGRYHRSLQAGLLGQDTLIVVDEAHLSPTFVKTVRDVHYHINQYPSLRRAFLITLSATNNDAANEDDAARPPLSIFGRDELADDLEDRQGDAYRRLYADKKLSWLTVSASAEGTGRANSKVAQERMVEAIVECAAKYFEQNVSVVIYLNTVEAVNQVTERLQAALQARGVANNDSENRILTLTGEMRGHERDRLFLEENILTSHFKRRKERAQQKGCYFLIATAAAEVGVNFDADHGICDLVALERMIQRFGRINRFGDGAAEITAIFDEQSLQARASASQEEPTTVATTKSGVKPLESAAYYTYLLLQSQAATDGSIDVSPIALRALEVDKNALTTPPVRPPLDAARIDDWSLTSLRQDEYPRPLVSYWLRGVISDDTIQTTFCWRADLDYAISEPDSEPDAIKMVEAIPIAPREKAEVAIHRALALVKELAKTSPGKVGVLIDANGGFTSLRLGSLKDVKDDDLRRKLAFATLVLPCTAGGLDRDGNPRLKLSKAAKSDDKLEDAVEDDWTRLAIIKPDGDNEYRIQGILRSNGDITPVEGEPANKSFTSPAKAASAYAKSLKDEKVSIRFISGMGDENAGNGALHPSAEGGNPAPDGALTAIAYLLKRNSPEHFFNEEDDASLNVRHEQSITEHNKRVADYAEKICLKLGLESSLASTVAVAGSRHDTGKARLRWQRAIGNGDYLTNDKGALAKSNHNWFNQRANAGYRHEFGSLVDALDDEEINGHSHRELILHLIAAHHGYARPFFPERAFDVERLTVQENRRRAGEVMQRFARLQCEYGWWQLAYLEALLKAADGLASREIEEQKS